MWVVLVFFFAIEHLPLFRWFRQCLQCFNISGAWQGYLGFVYDGLASFFCAPVANELRSPNMGIAIL
jgi:hypothetical protein